MNQTAPCDHLATVEVTTTDTHVCPECIALGVVAGSGASVLAYFCTRFRLTSNEFVGPL